MNIPNIPTDNYYKFFALSGVTIALSSILFYSSKINSLYDEIDLINTEVSALELEAKFLVQDRKIIETKLTELEKILPNTSKLNADSIILKQFIEQKEYFLREKNYRDYYEFLFKYEDKLLPFKSKLDFIESETDRISKMNREFENKASIIGIKNDILKRKNKRLLIISFILSVLTIIGYNIAKYGFKQWYNKVQKPSDEKLELELKRLREAK